MSEKQTKRVFVVGVPRSGTTLIQYLFSAHPEIVSFTESHFFRTHFHLIGAGRFAVVTGDVQKSLSSFVAENAELTEELISKINSIDNVSWWNPFAAQRTAVSYLEILDSLAAQKGRRIWVEKTPNHLWYADYINNLCRDCSFVHIVRDGRQTVASLYDASRKWNKPLTIEQCVKRWNSDIKITVNRCKESLDQLVLYERLATDPLHVMTKLFENLGISTGEYNFQDYTKVSQGLVKSDETWKQDVTRPIAISESFSLKLNDEQRRYVEQNLNLELYELARKLAL